jgi:HD-like signal output (HDOD) protein
MQLERLLQTPRALPAVPEVAARLIATFNSDDVDLGSVASDIDLDPVMAAKVLQQANSSFFRLLRPVPTVREALMILGLNRVRALVISTAMNDSFHAVSGMNLDRFWHYSLSASVVAKYICEPLRLDENIALTTGLLHGVGELVMHIGMPEYMTRMDAAVDLLDLRRAEYQYEALGYSYAEVGAALAKEWRLPKPMVEAIARHARPLEGDADQPLAAVVHLAAWRSRVFLLGNQTETLIHTYPDAVGLMLDMDPDVLVSPDLPPLQFLPTL